MRILVLSKRQYTGRDLLGDRYGRLYEIPAALAARGHQVTGIALSYRRRDEPCRDDLPGLRWFSVNALPGGLFRYPRLLAEIVAKSRPEVIWASSDALHGIIGWCLSRRFGIPLLIDLYDNYESFGASKIPGMTALFRRACRAADALTVVSGTLAEYVGATYGALGPCLVLGNAVPKNRFFPRDRRECRRALGLPLDKRLMGTAGAITEDRGISVLFEAFLQLAAEDPDLWLVLAGPRDETPGRYPHERIVDLGTVAPERVPLILNALDVAVICNLDSNFGRYCFPQKLYEIAACGVPLVAAGVGEMMRLLAPWPDCLFVPGSAAALAERIRDQRRTPVPLQGFKVPTWEDQAIRLERFLGRVI